MAHYSEKEKILLAMLVKEHSILENKKTDAATVQLKQQEWEQLTLEYNGQPEINNARTSIQLKTLWKNLKQKKRAFNTSLQYETLKTGGGPPPKVDDDVVMSIVSDAAPYMDVTLQNCFDSTAVFEDEVLKDISEPQSTPSTSSCLTTAKNVTPVKLLKSSNKRKTLYTTSSDEATLRSDRIKKMMQNDMQLHQARMEVINIEKEKAAVDLEFSKLKLKLLKQNNIL